MTQRLMMLAGMGVAFSWALALAGGWGMISHSDAAAAGGARSGVHVTARFDDGEDDSADEGADHSGPADYEDVSDDHGSDESEDVSDDHGGDGEVHDNNGDDGEADDSN